jgi:hypothetical protein
MTVDFTMKRTGYPLSLIWLLRMRAIEKKNQDKNIKTTKNDKLVERHGCDIVLGSNLKRKKMMK